MEGGTAIELIKGHSRLSVIQMLNNSAEGIHSKDITFDYRQSGCRDVCGRQLRPDVQSITVAYVGMMHYSLECVF